MGVGGSGQSRTWTGRRCERTRHKSMGSGERKGERKKALGPVVELAGAAGGGETHGNGPFCGVYGPPSSLWELPAELRALSNPSSFSRSGCSLGELSGHPLPPLAPRGHQLGS